MICSIFLLPEPAGIFFNQALSLKISYDEYLWYKHLKLIYINQDIL